MLGTLAVALKGLGGVAQFDGAVEFGVGFGQGARHRRGIVRVGQAILGKARSGAKTDCAAAPTMATWSRLWPSGHGKLF